MILTPQKPLKFNKNEKNKNNTGSYNFMKGTEKYMALNADSYQEAARLANGNTKNT